VLDEIIKCIGQLSTIVTTTILKTSYVQGIYVQGAGTQEKPYYAHSARVAGWSQVLDRWEKPDAFAVSDIGIQKSILLYSCHIVRKFLNIDTEHNTQQSQNAEARRRNT
jgi:hypothetical protein